ncbi:MULTISPECIES: hypothetical protein [unclassified Micromonospora]|nr:MULTISPECIES: hypothetical protein [unclassified Micromonospora]MBU8861684.1 hypothetical protein [Micromonospora sp. WMMB482]MDM4781253.1 hypothetical protein [Micromonospora sp. b486]
MPGPVTPPEDGSCLNRRVIEDDLDGGHAAIRADIPPPGGHWQGNHGEQ